MAEATTTEAEAAEAVTDAAETEAEAAEAVAEVAEVRMEPAGSGDPGSENEQEETA
ncbi:MAG: hypothetical protein GXX90_08745 [Microbacteriaceae bacterium]|nr:hypothetical protein [Microbacteriaceae bacterium]